MLKKKIALSITFAMIIGLFAGCGSASTSGSAGGSDEIKIGVVMPLTGAVATFGQSGKNGLTLLQDQINSKGGINGKKVSFVFGDDENKPASAVSVGQKLINDDKVVAIVGPLTSTCANSLAPIAQQNKIPMVSGTATNPKVTQAGDFIFRTCFIDPFQGTVIAKFAASDLNAKTAAILYDNGNDYSKGLADFFKKSFEEAGGKIVASETYTTNDQDFNAQLTKMKSSNPDVLLLPDYYQTVGLIAKQAKSIGLKTTFLGGDGWDSADLFKVGGDAVNGAYFSDHYSPDDTTPDVVQFISDYKAKYNSVPDAMAALNYDAGKVLVQAIQSAGKTDPDSIKDALQKYNGTVVSGKVTFDKDRNAVKSAVIIKADAGKLNFVKKVNP
jgi:branched-chain amino acid transport system substrate-binding protein